MQEIFDVLIVGAGPAGCSCALSLHQAGLKVGLIDKESFPRDKICGDAIPGPAFKLMGKINLTWQNRLFEFSESELIKSSKAYFPNGKSLKVDWKTFSYNSPRIHFDQFLKNLVEQETNTISLTPNRLKKVVTDDNCLNCFFLDGTMIKTKILVGADGANSVVKRFLPNNQSDKGYYAASVRAYVKNIEGLESNTNEFYYLKKYLPGYLWIFPLNNGLANIGFGMEMKNDQQHKSINLKESLIKILQEEPIISPRCKQIEFLSDVKGFGLPMYSRQLKISGNRILLCGDAASLIDPLMGHGIDKAMVSGHLAALQIMKCAELNKFSDDYLSLYDQAVYSTIGIELKRSQRMTSFINKYPYLMNILANLLSNKNLLQWLVKFAKI